MAIVIDVNSVRARYPQLAITNVMLEDIITIVNAMVVPCLEQSYPESIGYVIAYNLIAHLSELSTGRRIKSQTAPNGASQSFDFGRVGDGLNETSFGRMVAQLDTEGCSNALSPPQVGILTIGGRNEPYGGGW